MQMPFDWGGGYYPPGLLQADLIKQLLMYGVTIVATGYANAPLSPRV